MTSTTFEGITISSQFIGIGKRLDNSGYNAICHILFPKYSVTINNETFEYSQSPKYLADAIGVKQGWIHEHTYKHPTTGALKSEIYLDSGPYTRGSANNVAPKIFPNRTTSINDVSNKFAQSKACELPEKELLYELRAILEDALIGFQYLTPGEFGEEFGYTDIDKCIEVFNACNQTKVKLRLSETKIYKLIEKLSEKGIE